MSSSPQIRVNHLHRRDVFHNERGAACRNRTGHALSERNALARRCLIQSDRGAHGQRLPVFRQQEDRGGVCCEQFSNTGQHLAQHIVERKARESAVGHRLQPPDTLRRMFRLGARRPLASEQLFALGFGLLEVMNIGRGPDPLHDLSLHVADRTPARQVPAVLAVLAAKAVLGLKRLPCLAGLPQLAPRAFTVIGVNRLNPLGSEGLLHRNAYILDPPLIAIIHQPIRAASVNDLGHGVGELAEARLALDNRFFGLFARGDVGVCDDGPPALATQRRYRHQKPALLTWRVAGIFNCEIGARAVQHRLNAGQRRLYLAIALLLSSAADVQIIDAHAVGNDRAAAFSRETSPVFIDGNDVSVPVEHGDVGRKRVDYSLVERLALAQRRLRAFALSDVGGDAANGVRPPALVAEWKLDREEVVRPICGDDSLFDLKRRIGRNYFLLVGAYGVCDLLGVHVVSGLAFYLSLRHAEQDFIPAIDPQVMALKVFDKDDCDGMVEDGAQLRLAIAERLFNSPALGYVAQRGGKMRHFAALVARRPDGPFEI